MLPSQYKPSDPVARAQHEAELKENRWYQRSKEERNAAILKEAIAAIASKYNCSYEAAKLLFENKAY